MGYDIHVEKLGEEGGFDWKATMPKLYGDSLTGYGNTPGDDLLEVYPFYLEAINDFLNQEDKLNEFLDDALAQILDSEN